MRSLWLASVLALVVGLLPGCGDNLQVDPDARLPACSDGVDNDSDGTIDFPLDLGCDSRTDESEDSPTLPKCSDNRDNDGDGKTDYPNDPGCIAAQADDETDDCPDGPGCPQCANGKDDDASGSSDFPNDPGCESAADTEEFVSNPNACGPQMLVKPLPPSLTDSGVFDGTSLSMIMSPCGGGGGASGVAYELHLSEPKIVVATTSGAADTVIDLRGVMCQNPDSHITCNDDMNADTVNSQIVQMLPAGNYYLIVQGHDSAALGDYTITVQLFGVLGSDCTDNSQCGPGLVCRIPFGETDKKCVPPVCSDGVDDDGDGKIDFPNDPGCDTPADDTENDTCPGAGCPACANGADDDGDGQTDFPMDTSCTAASGQSESCNGEEDPIVQIVAATTMADATGAHDNHDPSCGGNLGVDRLFTINIPRMRSLTIDTENSGFDTVLSLMTAACQEPSLGCDDDGGTTGNNSLLTVTNLDAGTYIVAVDAFSDFTTPGLFNVHIAGVLAPGSSCEPAATFNGAFVCPAANPCGGPAGSQICLPSICLDGIDNDGDGKTDFPTDPGCANEDDGDEADNCPSGAGCPACSDGVDNDADGFTDFPNDPSCTAASGGSESCSGEEDPVLAITSGTTNGTLVGAHDNHDPSCGGDGGPDVILTLALPQMATLTIDTENTVVDTVLSLMPSTCQEPSLACDDDGGVTANASLLSFTNLAAGNYTVAVDAFSSFTTLNTFVLHVNGVIANGASCEGALADSGAIHCSAAATCAGPPGNRVCVGAACSDGLDNDGDGRIDYPNEPGCDSPSDNSEVDTCPGAGCPACADTTDNDTDADVDFAADLSCWAASSPLEAFCNAENDRALATFEPAFAGTTAGKTNDFATQSCQANAAGADVAVALTLPVAVDTLTIDTVGTPHDTVLSVRDSACGVQLACDDDGVGLQSSVTLNGIPAGTTLSIIVDGFNGQSGPFTLHAQGTVVNGTACTDPLFTSGVLSCTAPATCTAGTCQ